MDTFSVIPKNYKIFYDYATITLLISSILITVLNPSYEVLKKNWLLYVVTIFNPIALLIEIVISKIFGLPFYITLFSFHFLMMVCIITVHCCCPGAGEKKRPVTDDSTTSDSDSAYEFEEA